MFLSFRKNDLELASRLIHHIIMIIILPPLVFTRFHPLYKSSLILGPHKIVIN